MPRITLGLLIFLFVTLESYATVDSKQFLLDQMLWGEVYQRDDFVKNALERLTLIAPNEPEILAARISLALREKNYVLAETLLEELKHKEPRSIAYKKAQMSFYLSQPKTQQMLQKARVLALSGHPDLAKAQYDVLFHGDFPTLKLSTEYWMLVAQIPQEQHNAFLHLQKIYQFLNTHQIYEQNNLHYASDNWPQTLKETLARLWVSKGNQNLQAGFINLAQKDFQQAILLNNKNDSAWVGIGDVAFSRKDYIQAEKLYKKAHALEPHSTLPIYGLLGVYKRQSLQKALNYLDRLPTEQKIQLQEARLHLESALLQQEAQQLETRNHWKQALKKYDQAQKIDPNDVWLIYHYALALDHEGESQKATLLFHHLVQQQRTNPIQVYAYALYLSSRDKVQQALAHLHTLPKTQWNEDIRQLVARLTKDLIITHAEQLRDSGQNQAAVDYLLQQTPTTPIKLTLADWAYQDNEFAKALRYYQKVMFDEPLNPDANLGAIESLIALGSKNQAQQLLNGLQKKNITFELSEQRRLANAWARVGDIPKAVALYQKMKQKSQLAAPSQDSALIFRDAARLETQLHQPKLATNDYKKAMVQSNITSIWPEKNNYYTWLMHNHPQDDWVKRSIRSDAAALYQQQETRVTVDEDYWILSGTPGTSEIEAKDTIIQTGWGLYNGRSFLRADVVNLNAGNFSPIDGVYFSDFGTCAINGCTSGVKQRAYGISWDGGWNNPVWGFDLGQTPLGFPVSNWVGGINYSGQINYIGWTLTASQRPMTNSLLSFAGAVDPNTGITWGGVVATGLTLSLSYDRGGANGFWANVIASRVTGEKVASNERILLLDGYYYRIINKENSQLTVGLTNMVWHYAKNLYGFNLGQGGYYSPDFYLSFTVPIGYRKRTQNWSYELGGTVTWSHATTQDLAPYPITNLIPNINSADNSISYGGNSIGYGYSLLALVERRLGSHFILGGLINYQQSTDYTPTHCSLFLRYSFEGWQGDMDMHITPLIPYSTFR